MSNWSRKSLLLRNTIIDMIHAIPNMAQRAHVSYNEIAS